MSSFSSATASTHSYTLSLHDALPISAKTATCSCSTTRPTSRGSRTRSRSSTRSACPRASCRSRRRSEEHTSELQSRRDLVCRLLLEKKNENKSKLVVERQPGSIEYSG